MSIRKPSGLKVGDRIRLIAPASPFPREQFEAGRAVLEQFGLQPVFDREVFARRGFLAGSDTERAHQVSAALLEPDTQAVWCIRGGYGTERILPLLDLPRLRRAAKLVIGFSDITALLLQMVRPGGCVAIHGPVVTQLPRLPAHHRRWLKKLLFEAEAPRNVPLGRMRTLVAGCAAGTVVAVNLSILASLAGTRYAPDLRGSLLCLEDVTEKAYRLDRLVWQCASAGLFKDVRGVILGELVECTPERGRYAAQRVLESAIASIGVPAVSGAAFGHADRNIALPLGVRARLDAGAGTLTLLEPAISRPRS